MPQESPHLSARPCPCPRCAAEGSERATHRALRALMDYVAPPHRAFAASQLDLPRTLGEVDDALLCAICELEPGAVEPHRVEEQRYHVLQQQRLEQLAEDAPTRELLQHHWQQRLHGTPTPAGGGAHHDLSLRVRGRALRLRLPDSLAAYQVLFELFLTEPYRELPAVPVLYDLGAHLGLASLAFFARHPATRFVCVEPLAENCALLEENLRQNGVQARVLAAAVGAADGEVELHTSLASPSLNSVFPLLTLDGRVDTTLQGELRRVPCLALDHVVTEAGGGIKLDVEGAEHQLLGHAATLQAARWVTGELHLGPALVPPARAFALLDVLAERHELTLSPPGLFGRTVTYTFRALRPLRLFEDRRS